MIPSILICAVSNNIFSSNPFVSSTKKFLQRLIQWTKRICINSNDTLQQKIKSVKMLNFIWRRLQTYKVWFYIWRKLQRVRALYSAASVGHFLCKNVHGLHHNFLTSETQNNWNTLREVAVLGNLYACQLPIAWSHVFFFKQCPNGTLQ